MPGWTGHECREVRPNVVVLQTVWQRFIERGKKSDETVCTRSSSVWSMHGRWMRRVILGPLYFRSQFSYAIMVCLRCPQRRCCSSLILPASGRQGRTVIVRRLPLHGIPNACSTAKLEDHPCINKITRMLDAWHLRPVCLRFSLSKLSPVNWYRTICFVQTTRSAVTLAWGQTFRAEWSEQLPTGSLYPEEIAISTTPTIPWRQCHPHH